jgi:DNA-binding response OmpR family regulator
LTFGDIIDERIPAEFLKEILEKEDYEVVAICDTGAGAIEQAGKLLPDVIFMDIMLKDKISGSEAALEISSQIKTKIIFLTAHTDSEMIEYALDVGAVNYLIKPYKEKQILTALKLALNRKTENKDKTDAITLANGYFYSFLDKRLYLNNKEVNLGLKSTQLIQCLCKNIDRTVSSEELSLFIYDDLKQTSRIRTLISRLNKTLDCNIVENSNGLGYKIMT